MSALENSTPSVNGEVDPAGPPFELPLGFRPWSPSDGDRHRPELGPEARHGLVGDVAELFEVDSEIDGAAVIVQLLAEAGAMVGRTNYFPVGVDRLFPNLFVAVVGPSGTGRKGMAMRAGHEVVRRADPAFADQRIVGGLRSAEGLINLVRDEDVIEGERVARSPDDQRAVIEAPELIELFRSASRPSTNLAEALGQAADGAILRSAAHKVPVRSTQSCVSVIGNIEDTAALEAVTGSHAATGLAGHFLWVWSQRRQEVALPRQVPEPLLESRAERHGHAIQLARAKGGEWTLSPSAKGLWEKEYPALSNPPAGLQRRLLARSPAIVLKTAMLYAILDAGGAAHGGEPAFGVVQAAHLSAALALCRYSAATVEYVFGDAQGDLLSDRLLTAVRAAGPSGLSATDQFKLGCHPTKDQLGAAREVLEARHLIAIGHRGTGSTRTRVSVAISPAS